MDVKCPSCLLDAANELASFVIRRRLLGQVERMGTGPAEPKCRRHTPMAGAVGAVRGETAVHPRERFDRRAGVLQTLAKKVGRNVQCLGGFSSGKLENLA